MGDEGLSDCGHGGGGNGWGSAEAGSASAEEARGPGQKRRPGLSVEPHDGHVGQSTEKRGTTFVFIFQDMSQQIQTKISRETSPSDPPPLSLSPPTGSFLEHVNVGRTNVDVASVDCCCRFSSLVLLDLFDLLDDLLLGLFDNGL